MTVCRYFLEGRCHYGDRCWNEHPSGGRNQTVYSGGGSVNRKWVNPSQRPGGGAGQPSSFSRGGGDWGRGNSGSGKDEWGSNLSFNTQNRFSALNSTQSGHGRSGGGGGGGGEDDTDYQLDLIQKDMEVWQSSGQWLFSCYAAFKSSVTGFVELSPEELRMEYFTSRATGDVQSYVNSVQQLVNQWRSRVQELRTMSSHTRTSMIAEMSNPRPSSSSSAGFGSAPSAGFGSAPSAGFGSAIRVLDRPGFWIGGGFWIGPIGGFWIGPIGGFWICAIGRFWICAISRVQLIFIWGSRFGSSVQSAADFSFSASSSGFGSSGSQTAPSQFGSSAPSASSFSFALPAGATASKSSTTGFGFSSSSAGGFSGSSTAPSGGAGVSGTAEDRKNAGELHTPLSDLTPDELREFSAKRFTLGQIPIRAPPTELLQV
ncbi:Nucleoporin-like protein 2 [Bagarius yarrelli]|uniref:Nucleoporin NUP42 n=1 Tax=Bagarius yarrelli TaxID=175774 RepID=A0A556VVX2_BAGYA|nr:Nucleoporin-like protein 2 [Bagarius yarrelli]